MPLPYGPAAPVLEYFGSHHTAVQVTAVAVFASSVPLGIYAATASTRLLVAGMAVPSRILGPLPRSLAWTGLAIALLAELATVALVWPGLGMMLPVARASALVWLLVAGARLPLRRAAHR